MANILVVDDELGIRELLSEILNDEGHSVDLAENATQARALRFLVSAAVAGMKPEDVAIIDSRNGLVASDADGAGRAGDEKAADAAAGA